MVDALFASFDGAYSKNTIRAYRADFSDHEHWCHTEGMTPVPASGQQLANYIDSMAGLKSVATIQRRVASLGSLFRSKIDPVGQGLQLPVSPTLVIQIRLWQAQIGCHTEFIVPTIHADGVVLNEPLADAQVNKILRARQQEAGLDLEPPLSNQQCPLHERSTEAINTESNSRPVNPAVFQYHDGFNVTQ